MVHLNGFVVSTQVCNRNSVNCILCNHFRCYVLGVVSAFGTVNHVQQVLTRMAKCTLKEFQQKVSEVLNTSPNARIWLFLKRATLCFASRCSPIFIHLVTDFTG